GGQGMSDDVRALQGFGADAIIAAGSFTSAGPIGANRIASWSLSRSQWTPLGGGLDFDDEGVIKGHVEALALFPGDLLGAGEFNEAWNGSTSISVDQIARWNGSWQPLAGAGACGQFIIDVTTPRALVDFNGTLVMGGDFVVSAGPKYVASWDAGGWSPFGLGPDDAVLAFAVPHHTAQPQLIVGGDFMMAGGATANRIAVWNGSAWSPLGNGFNGSVDALAIFRGKVIAGGLFTQTMDTP